MKYVPPTVTGRSSVKMTSFPRMEMFEVWM